MTDLPEKSFLEARGIATPTTAPHPGPKYAKRLVELGAHVHPLQLGKKIPATENGVLDAAPDASAITGNYGVAMGPSGLVAIDLDDYVEGNDIEAFVEKYELPATFTVRTGSGGRQLWYRAPEGLDLRNKADLGRFKGVDVRANGGYSLGPGNKLAKSEVKKGAPGNGEYTYDTSGIPEFAPLPQKLADAILEAQKPKEISPDKLAGNAAAYDALDDRTKKQVDAWLDRTVGSIMAELDGMKRWPEGHREEYRGELEGWEAGVLRRTYRLAQLVNADWNPLGKDDVIGLLRQNLPNDASFTLTDGLGKFVRALGSADPAHYPIEEEVDLLSGVEDRSRSGKAEGGSPDDGEEVTWEAKLIGGVQGHILFDTKGCRRIQVDDDGKKKEKELLPATTAKRLISSWPIAKQPLSRAQNWWVYKEGAWVLNDSIVRLSMAASFADSYKTADVAPVEDILSTMAHEIEVEPHPEYINFRNGMLEWRTGELHDHSPDFKSTVQLPHDWTGKAECPMFDEWLVERLPIDGVKLAWQLIAATIYSGIVSQRAGLLYGVGKSGKSTFLELVQGLVGASNCSALSPQAMTKTVFATHALLGKQANIVTDIDPTKITETAIFKQVVAGEPIQAQQKNKPEFTFRPFANHLFSANQIPRSSDRTSAWTRRFAILRFTEVIGGSTVVVDRFDKILLQEAEGIIAKAVTFLPDLIRDGYSLIEADQEEFEAATDFTKDFWADAVNISGDPKHFTATTQLAQAFDMWCQTNRIRNSPPFADVELALRDNPIVEKARRRPLGAARTTAALRGWRGVELQPEYRPQIAPYDAFFDGDRVPASDA